MSYEQLTWIDPFIYREWPVRLAHRICVKSKDLKSFPHLRFYVFYVLFAEASWVPAAGCQL
jgi:hypothetical protein